MKTNYEGCALCDATWGEYWREIEGQNMFFCCNICADAYENMIGEVKKKTGWEELDYVEITGNYRLGRTCRATKGDSEYKYFFRHENGNITQFEER
ncbi:hypothetical protein IX51_07650 [uncultured archaeon]|nr:hypothetical protein IX51_07650 [uncultured archaeon]